MDKELIDSGEIFSTYNNANERSRKNYVVMKLLIKFQGHCHIFVESYLEILLI